MLPLAPLLATLLAQAPDRVTLVFGGDVIPHGPVKQVAKLHARYAQSEDGEAEEADGAPQSINHLGWDHVLGALSPVFRRNDLAVVNLETPVTTRQKVATGEMVFNARPDLLQGLKANGVSIATFANNHVLDQGEDGITETRAHLAEAGLLTAGAGASLQEAWTPLELEKNGIKVCVLAFSRYLNDEKVNPRDPKRPHAPVVEYRGETKKITGISEAMLLEVVKATAPRCEALIVSVHWGEEYVTAPFKVDRALAQQLLDAGAIAVIGSHPHVLQSVETLTRADGSAGLVAFSLGNLVSNQDDRDPTSTKRDGLLLEVELARDAKGVVRLGRVNAVPTFTENKVAQGRKRNVQALLVDDEITAMTERLAELAPRADKASQAEKKALSKRLQQATDRRERIRSMLSKDLRLAAASAAARP